MDNTYAACRNCHSVNRINMEKAHEAICGRCKSPIQFHGLVSEANTDEFHKILRASDKPVIVDFWASWCGPCKMYGPEFEKASLQNRKAVFIKINTEAENQLAGQLGIRSIPTTVVFRDGKETFRQSGVLDANTLNRILSP